MRDILHLRFWSSICAVANAIFACTALGYAQTAPPAAIASPGYREVTDEVGRVVRIRQSVSRIVSLAPSLTETIYALGLQDKLVGDTDFCDYPPEAQKKPKVGGGINPSLEIIASLHPDLVLATKSYDRLATIEALDELGIPSYATNPHSINDIIASTRTLANILGVPEAGAVVASGMEHHLADVQARLSGLPPKRVLFVVWTQPLISTGRKTFLADALRLAGAASIVDSSQDWPQVNLEEVARLQPDFLIFADSNLERAAREVDALTTLPGWKIVNAINNRRYVVISDAVNRPAPRIVSAIEELARQLHPEAFAEKRGDAKGKIENQNFSYRLRSFSRSCEALAAIYFTLSNLTGGCACVH